MNKLIGAVLLFCSLQTFAQKRLQPGFNNKEYLELLSLAFHSSSIPDSNTSSNQADEYKMLYRSPETGLLNRWTLYLRNDNVAVIDVRGTVNKLPSWLANFYAAMIPATGSLQLNDSTRFDYKLCDDKKAMVHVGWTLALAHLAPDIRSKINTTLKEKNVKEILLFGHSQGAAINFLLRSWLEVQKKEGAIPADLVFKTYCSAAPKPGNMYYAYDFDFITRGGWGLTVVNAADWVPETPFSIQTLSDFNPTNIFVTVKPALKKQKFFIRLAGNILYNRMDRVTRKAQKKYCRYLGKMIYKQVKKTLPQYKQPVYAEGNNYMRAGQPIILMPDEEYRNSFPESTQDVFIHHQYKPYAALVKKIYP